MVRQIGIGNGSFRKVRVGGFELVDKTHFVEQVCQEAAEVLLLPRPRRFGKTFLLSMLKEFFAIPTPGEDGKPPTPDARVLFQGLYLESVWDSVAPHFQRYPTVMLNFKGMLFSTREEWWAMVAERISAHAQALSPLFTRLPLAEQPLLAAYLNRSASSVQLGLALQKFTQWLHRSTGERALVLIDEYDAPIQQAWTKANELTPQAIALLPTEVDRIQAQRKQRELLDLYQEVIGFFRAFLGNGLKDNESLYKAIVTGILRVSKESLFSDFNNPEVCTMLDAQYADACGFTEAEVHDLFIRQEQPERLVIAQHWYNGYRFGNTTIYNPWSVLSYLKKKPEVPGVYWLNSSENALVKQLLRRGTPDIADDFERLLKREPVVQTIRDGLSLGDLAKDREGLFNLLYWSGYLKAELQGMLASGEAVYRLAIPNQELRMIFQESFRNLLKVGEAAGALKVQTLTESILTGNVKVLQVLLSNLTVHLISYLDGDPNNPEAFYQGLMLGLCAWLEGEYTVRSNRETGLGRADLLILPKTPGKPGALLELKSTRTGQSLDSLIRQGERQVKKREYARELEASGAYPLHRWVVAFDGKLLKVKKLKAEG